MRVAVLNGLGDLTVVERPEPQAGPGQVVVRIASVGVCGSDTHYYDHGRPSCSCCTRRRTKVRELRRANEILRAVAVFAAELDRPQR